MKSFLLLCLLSCLLLKWRLSHTSNADSRFGRMLRRLRPERYATETDWIDGWEPGRARMAEEHYQKAQLLAVKELLARLDQEPAWLNRANGRKPSEKPTGMTSKKPSETGGDSHGR